MCYQTFHGTEKPLLYDRMSGLDSEQLDELVLRIEEQLDGPWDKGIGRPKSLTLREAIIITCGYMRQNIIQEVWAEIFDTSQPVISGIIGKFTPLVEAAAEEDRPTAEEAKEAAVREQTVLVEPAGLVRRSRRARPGIGCVPERLGSSPGVPAGDGLPGRGTGKMPVVHPIAARRWPLIASKV
jgi:hypothetical protein